MDVYSVEKPTGIGHSYDREIRVMMLGEEIGVFNGAKIQPRNIEAMTWILNWLLDGSLELEDVPVVVEAR